ncbi:deoxynucleotidyltransferase terminal-interacting protein 2 [Notolabrus celidotus]|uniref:deoxynucleotidyltransferase terminal-interacting protein 2 n=1 Tax=Notolabrus celidotus TaxID=1203425 RepID=UPI00148FA8F0|nr:deoxynucleotidyltransferase terminal-interacting protein 2 [Notolabrus celidotus]
MVATRRGVRVYSPTKTNPDMSSDVQATPSTGRRTRRTAIQAGSPTHHGLVQTSSQLEKCEGESHESPSTPVLKRCTRAFRLHSPDQQCTPVGSIHEADHSDVDSCCSVLSDIKTTKKRTTGRKRAQSKVSQEEEQVSEADSCSSAASVLKAGHSVRRSTRKKTIPTRADPDQVEEGDVQGDLVTQSESCSSVVSESKRVTRSYRKTRSSAKQQPGDSELSDMESCMSGISEVSKSTTRRSTRSRRQTGSIPINLDEATESSPAPTPRPRRARSAREKAAATVHVDEPPNCDSEGFESGPNYSKSTCRWGKQGPMITDSDSELTDVQSPLGSPCSTRSRGTPCSSRTGSGSSSRGVRASRHSIKDLSIVLEKAAEPTEEEGSSFNDSRLESTVLAEDKDCTLLEDDESQNVEEKEDENQRKESDLTSVEEDVVREEKDVNVLPEGEPLVAEVAEEDVCKPAVTVEFQQEEPCAERKLRDTSEMEMIQETEPPSSELLEPSVTATLCGSTPEIIEEAEDKEEAMEAADVDANLSQTDKAVDEAVVVETRPSEEKGEREEEGEREEKMEVSTVAIEDQQVVDSREVESIQVSSNEKQKIQVDSTPEPPKDVIVQKTKVISLLESSEDEDEDAEEEERDVSEKEEEEDLECRAEERGGPSKAASTSVGGLFMIDTRPGEEADEHYYKDRLTEEEKATKGEGVEQEEVEEEEDFVDEEGEDDDDEDAMILFSSRNPNLKEMSSRIDPGIRVKELGGLYINFDGSKSKPVSGSLQKLKEKKIQDEVMKKSVMGPDFEKKDAVPPSSESKQALKLKRRVEKEKTTGDGWFNMKAPEITQELKGDLKVLKMRGSTDPKRFYKKNDRDGFPKYFQVGTVVDNPVDFYHSRIPKKDRKRTMVEELMADAEFRHNNKKKYQNIVAEKAARGAGRRHKKNKFHKK